MSSSAAATVRVEKATSDLLMGPDWTLNMDICDSVNSDHWQAKDVVKAMKKRLQHKNPKVQFLALTLLETMIKNCGDYVHFQVVDREILHEMVRIVKKKTDMQVRDKILVLLDSWQEAFGGAGGKYPQYYWAYADLKCYLIQKICKLEMSASTMWLVQRSGVQFPERPPESTLIFTLAPVHAMPIIRHPPVGHGMPSNPALRLDEAMASEMSNLCLSDLASIQSVMELLSEMLKAVKPDDRAAVKDEVIIDLVNQCRFNQRKLMQSINSIRDEELLARGLELNDNLQSLLAKHDAIASGSPLAAEVSDSVPSPGTPVIPQPSATSRYDAEEEDEDDDFAQLARRNMKINPAGGDSKSIAISDDLGSQNGGAIVLSTVAASTDGASSSAARNRLPDPPAPVKTATKEQDVIDLLSITLPSNPSPPPTPPTPPIVSDQWGSSPPVQPVERGYSHSPQSYVLNQSYITQNSFISPWLQIRTHSPSPHRSQPEPETRLNSSGYPPPPWATAPADTNANPFASTAYPALGADGSAAAAAAAAAAAYTSMQPSRPVQRYNSFGSRFNNVPADTAGTQTNASIGQMGQAAAPKPYVYTNRLFDDLRDLRNPSAGFKSSDLTSNVSGTSNQGMINGRK
ncbi:VHS and GAT domain containing protein [Musa troglodytarum]|uniref:VHS and GAT domain containing protein n=1 Tax=Musa troglodytarum TaxID=320322 RepID=A0A9E7KXY2_9LILI|nr:VHS and GAT domain containing protein [Musa troglodytarum]